MSRRAEKFGSQNLKYIYWEKQQERDCCCNVSFDCCCSEIEFYADQERRRLRSLEGELYRAARAGQEARVELLLADGADPSARLESDWTPLMVAAAWNRKGVVESLSEFPEARLPNAEGQTALMVAARMARLECVGALLRARFDARSTDAKGRNALMHAVLGQEDDGVEVVRRLASLVDLDSRDGHGLTALMLAAREKACSETIVALMELCSHETLFACDPEGRGALEFAREAASRDPNAASNVDAIGRHMAGREKLELEKAAGKGACGPIRARARL